MKFVPTLQGCALQVIKARLTDGADQRDHRNSCCLLLAGVHGAECGGDVQVAALNTEKLAERTVMMVHNSVMAYLTDDVTSASH